MESDNLTTGEMIMGVAPPSDQKTKSIHLQVQGKQQIEDTERQHLDHNFTPKNY